MKVSHGHPLFVAHMQAPRRPRRRILPGASGRRGPLTRVAAALHCLDTLLKTDSHGVPLRASAMVCNSFSDKSAKEGAIVVVCIVNGTHSLAIYGCREVVLLVSVDNRRRPSAMVKLSIRRFVSSVTSRHVWSHRSEAFDFPYSTAGRSGGHSSRGWNKGCNFLKTYPGFHWRISRRPLLAMQRSKGICHLSTLGSHIRWPWPTLICEVAFHGNRVMGPPSQGHVYVNH